MRLRAEGSPREGGAGAASRGLAFFLRWALRLGYAAVLLLVLLLSAYTAFNLFVRSGVTKVPDLAGMTAEEASGALANQGLTQKRQPAEDDYDAVVPAGRVLRQEPGSRALVKRGSEIEVALSLGPRVLEVQDLVGKTAQAAQVALAASGLAPGQRLEIFSREANAGTIVEHHPARGEQVAPGAAVDFLVSRGSREQIYLMPDLVYREFEDIRRFFSQRGFRFGSVKYEVYEGIPEGVILRQFPLAGHPLDRRDAVSLVVSKSDLFQ